MSSGILDCQIWVQCALQWCHTQVLTHKSCSHSIQTGDATIQMSSNRGPSVHLLHAVSHTAAIHAVCQADDIMQKTAEAQTHLQM